ncbi:MAG: SemiSWEET family sugar transporter [Phycisphaerales bacterium]|nr:SemiSWEET family sugar transporter [Phycisphaerales bacterium]
MPSTLAASTMEVVGYSAVCLTTAAFLPQAVRTVRSGSTRDLSFPTFSMLSAGTLLWLIYGIMRRDGAVIIANAITFPLLTTIWALIARDRWRARSCQG